MVDKINKNLAWIITCFHDRKEESAGIKWRFFTLFFFLFFWVFYHCLLFLKFIYIFNIHLQVLRWLGFIRCWSLFKCEL